MMGVFVSDQSHIEFLFSKHGNKHRLQIRGQNVMKSYGVVMELFEVLWSFVNLKA